MSRAARSQPRGPRAAMATRFTPMVRSSYVVTPVARVDPSDRYELVKRLAVGGMAEIWLAKMRGIEGFERQVVVKSMLPHLAEEDQYVKMFLEEARLGATLHHQNIAQVFDIGGSAERGYFFAMEYLDGVDLRAIVQHGRGPLPLEHALWVAMGVAAGLHYAHERVDATGKPMGIIHRDVSLSNVFVTRDGAVKLLDFGIAKAASRVAQTRPGSIRGKLSYMSPEQCQGEDLDRRTDLFSLGIVIYELTLGEPLFSGKNDAIVLDKVLNQRIVPPSERSHGFPSELDRIVMRALERDVSRRYQTANELLEDLQRFCQDHRLIPTAGAMAAHVQRFLGAAPRKRVSSGMPTISARDQALVAETKPVPDAAAPMPAGTEPELELSAPSPTVPSAPVAIARAAPGDLAMPATSDVVIARRRPFAMVAAAALLAAAAAIGYVVAGGSSTPKVAASPEPAPPRDGTAAPTPTPTPAGAGSDARPATGTTADTATAGSAAAGSATSTSATGTAAGSAATGSAAGSGSGTAKHGVHAAKPSGGSSKRGKATDKPACKPWDLDCQGKPR